jgi:hypothetical protein
MPHSLAVRLHHLPRRSSLRVLLTLALLAWATATAVLAAHRGAERRMTFDGAVQR